MASERKRRRGAGTAEGEQEASQGRFEPATGIKRGHRERDSPSAARLVASEGDSPA